MYKGVSLKVCTKTKNALFLKNSVDGSTKRSVRSVARVHRQVSPHERDPNIQACENWINDKKTDILSDLFDNSANYCETLTGDKKRYQAGYKHIAATLHDRFNYTQTGHREKKQEDRFQDFRLKIATTGYIIPHNGIVSLMNNYYDADQADKLLPDDLLGEPGSTPTVSRSEYAQQRREQTMANRNILKVAKQT